jgi:uncharacterized protein YbdZ (MbtH family)
MRQIVTLACATLALIAAPPGRAQAQGPAGTGGVGGKPSGATVTSGSTGQGAGQSKNAQRSVVCRGAPVPAGWILVNDLRDRSMCDGANPAAVNAYNVWALERYDNRPVDTVIEVCVAAPIPAGWTIVDIFRDKDVCGHPAELFTANVKKIRRAR